MNKYKIGDRVIVEESNVDYICGSHKGKTGTIVEILGTWYPYRVHMDFDGSKLWCEVAGYIEDKVEEKKVFTKKDLKTGMYGYFDNETDDYFVIVGDRFVYQGGSGDDVCKLNDNLVMPSGRKITALYEGRSFYHAKRKNATLIWKREEEKPKTKPLYNGKVVCIENTDGNRDLYTVGKVYQFVDGSFTADNGGQIKNWHKPVESFEEFNEWSGSKWIEVKE
jgi:hypothetical protein